MAQPDYAAFLQQFLSNPQSLSQQDVASTYSQLAAQAPPELVAEANAAAFQQLGPNQRAALANYFSQAHDDPNSGFDGQVFGSDAANPLALGAMAQRAGHQDPGLLGGLMSSPLGKMLLAAAAAYMVNRMLGGAQGQGRQAPQQSDPLGGLLGGILGGQLGGGQQQAPQQSDPLGGLLGGILGGQLGGGQQQVPQQVPPSGNNQGGAGSLDDLLGQLGGGKGRGSLQQGQPDLGGLLGGLLGGGRQAPGGGGLGDLLGGLLGGQQGGAVDTTPQQPRNQGGLDGFQVNPDAFDKKI